MNQFIPTFVESSNKQTNKKSNTQQVMDEQTVRQELIHSLEEWGVNDYSNKKHRDFRQYVLKEGCRQFKLCSSNDDDSDSTFEHLHKYSDTNLAFPNEKQQAIRFFFQTELTDFVSRRDYNILYEKTDYLVDATSYSNEPYYRMYERKRFPQSSSSRDNKKVLPSGEKGGNVIGYRLKRQFEGQPLELLDPFNRFEYDFTCRDNPSYIAERVFDDWFNSDDPSWQGKIMEVMVAIHSIYHQPCFSCKRRGSIRWNGGFETSWMDLVCTQCHSTYEVKSKQSIDKCASQMERNELSGGSYAKYWSHRNAIESRRKRCLGEKNEVDLQKMFLVIIPREESINRSGQKIRPVYCVEIDHVLPRLTSSSFRPLDPPCLMSKQQRDRYSILPIRSVIKTKTQQQRHRHDATSIGVVWFQLISGSPVDVFEIMKDVFVEHFGNDEYDRIDRLYEHNNDDEEKNEENSDNKIETEESLVGGGMTTTKEVDDDDDGIAKLTELVEQVKTRKGGVDGSSDDEWENLYSDSDD